MTVDRYTKGVLTVIALCLIYLCLGRPGIVTTASAQVQTSGYTRVVIAGFVDGTGKEWRMLPPSTFTSGAAPLPVVDMK